MEKLQSITLPYPSQPQFFLLSITYEKGQKAAEAQLLIAGPLSNCNRGSHSPEEKQWLIARPLDPPPTKKLRAPKLQELEKYGLGGKHCLI